MLQWLWTWYLEREDWSEIELQSWPDSSGRSYETLSRCSEQNPNTTDCDRWTCWFGWSETRTWTGDVCVSGRINPVRFVSRGFRMAWRLWEPLASISFMEFVFLSGCQRRILVPCVDFFCSSLLSFLLKLRVLIWWAVVLCRSRYTVRLVRALMPIELINLISICFLILSVMMFYSHHSHITTL